MKAFYVIQTYSQSFGWMFLQTTTRFTTDKTKAKKYKKMCHAKAVITLMKNRTNSPLEYVHRNEMVICDEHDRICWNT